MTIRICNYKKEWDVLLNNQIISGDYSNTAVHGVILEISG